ncbi:MAG: ATP-binding protein [Phycisphaerales bacterium]|jgi:signal transduction histidine kinase/DNA-binding response OmpR family regulator
MRVLLIEDNPGDSALLELMLADHGYSQIKKAETLAAGKAFLGGPAGERPDVVLLDLMLPDSTGLSSLRAIREIAPDIATVVLTGVEDDTLAIAAVREGAQDFFIKGKLGAEVLDRCLRHAVERERIRHQVIEREQLLRVAYEGVSVVPWDWDLELDIIRVGAPMIPRKAMGPNGVLTKGLERVHPDDRARVESEFSACIANATAARIEYRFLDGDGVYRWQQAVLQAQPASHRPAKKLLGVTMDVHRRRIAEDTLKALSVSLARKSGPDFLQALVLHLTSTLDVRWAMIARTSRATPSKAEVVAIADRSQLQPLFSYNLQGTPCAEAFAQDVCFVSDGASAAYPDDAILADMKVQGYAGMRLQDSKGRNVGLLAVLHDRPLPEDREATLQILAICAARVAAELERVDTERELLAAEANLRQAQKMEAIGTLASGIAHDFTNLLTAVQGHASLATAMLGPNHPALENLKQLEEAARQASGVASSLLTFARRSRPDVARVPLGPLLESSVMLFRSMRPPEAPLDVEIDPAKGVFIDADETQVRQLLINLLLNAAEAVELGGRVRLSATLLPESEGERFVQIVVADTGTGMSEAVREHAFEPFYTTKAHGTGLGLAVVHGVVREHGWKIDVESQLGEGTRITVTAPVREMVPNSGEPEHEGTWRGKRALVVMRAMLARGLVAGTLTESGMEVLQAADEKEAETLTDDDARPIDLIVIDGTQDSKVVPGIVGRVRSREPRAMCIVVGGSSGTGLSSPGVFVIDRPFQLIALKIAMDILERTSMLESSQHLGDASV